MQDIDVFWILASTGTSACDGLLRHTHKAMRCIGNVFMHSELRRLPVRRLASLEYVLYRLVLPTRIQLFKDPKIQGSAS